MNRYLYILLILLISHTGSLAQERISENIYVSLDKEHFVVGEEILFRVYVVDQHFKGSPLSKVAYIEICDTEKSQVQTMIQLENGMGAGKISIPMNTPSGVYQLSAYTRYMLNEGEEKLFKRNIGIINVTYSSDEDRVNLTDVSSSEKKAHNEHNEKSRLHIKTKNQYSLRETVNLSISNLPDSIVGLVVSVHRDDSLPALSQNYHSWKQVDNRTPNLEKQRWTPEYEGHIVMGQLIPITENLNSIEYDRVNADMGIVSKDICYIRGQVKPDNEEILFHTKNIQGTQELVTTASSVDKDKAYRVKILSPYNRSLPAELPMLNIAPESKTLMERSISAQLNQIVRPDSLTGRITPEDYYNLRGKLRYDLDEYTRFNTMRETFIEFVKDISIRKINGKGRLTILLANEKRFSNGNTLVLLDGAPIHDHEYIIDYNPRNVKYIDIYGGRYSFGGEIFECIVAFKTIRGNLSGLQLPENAQLTEYEFPQLYSPFTSPAYPTQESLHSRKPDFRHTLFWEPFAEKREDLQSGITFYTSDLCGPFKVKVEGITAGGEFIYGETTFTVTPDN